MREIGYPTVVERVRDACIRTACTLYPDVVQALEKAQRDEVSPLGKEILTQLLENLKIAKSEMIPICQDTGICVFFVEMGNEVKVVGGTLEDALNEGVRQGYKEGYLRASVVRDPLRRENTQDNTPAVIHYQLVKGDRLRILFEPKGGGCENMSAAKILLPGEGKEGVKRFVVETVKQAGANPCPPTIVGVGIGGTFEMAAILAKKATLREIGKSNPDPFYTELEKEILTEINKLGIGPMGLGGRITALACHIETYPCHITALPVAVNLQCHADRKEEIVI